VSHDARSDPPDGSKQPEASGLSRHIHVFFEDPALWPLLIIFVVHVSLGGALVLLSALRARSLPALALLAILLVLSADAVRRARRRRRVMLWIVMLWALSALTAVASSHFGLL
jgi:hypothetical protein